jgi:hypothetical protein
MKLSSKQGLLSMRGISARNTDKQANKNNNSFDLSTVPPVKSGCHGQGSGAEVPGKHDDVVLVQLVLINSG